MDPSELAKLSLSLGSHEGRSPSSGETETTEIQALRLRGHTPTFDAGQNNPIPARSQAFLLFRE